MGSTLGFAFAATAQPAMAQDDDGAYWLARKNQIVVTATRIEARIEDVPVTVSVKSAEQIADELVTDIRDLVRFEPGVSVQRQPARFGAALGSTGRAGNDSFNIRGIGGNRVLIQVDGVRVPDGFSFGAQAAGRGDYVDLGLVKSVEILRGPSSALYGSDGLAGAVSFITADPADFLGGGKSVGGLLRAAYASADKEFSETAILAGQSGDWSLMAAYTRRDYQELDNKGDVGGTGAARTRPNPQDGHSNAALARIVYDPASGHKLRLTGEYLGTRLYTNALTGLGGGFAGTVDRLEGWDTGERKRVSFDWSWQGDGAIDFARVALYWQDARTANIPRKTARRRPTALASTPLRTVSLALRPTPAPTLRPARSPTGSSSAATSARRASADCATARSRRQAKPFRRAPFRSPTSPAAVCSSVTRLRSPMAD